MFLLTRDSFIHTSGLAKRGRFTPQQQPKEKTLDKCCADGCAFETERIIRSTQSGSLIFTGRAQ